MKNNILLIILLLVIEKLILAQLPNIVEMEYFFDNDPGFGNGTLMTISSGITIDETFDLDISSLNVGYHKLFIRVKDSDGKWSLKYKKDIFKEEIPDDQPLPNIVNVEYYYDNDPGFGNGTPVPISPDSLIYSNFNADITILTEGYHKLFVRTKDEFNKWSLAYKKDIYKITPTLEQPLPEITYMEYFIDNDPGFGNGINVPITSDSIISVNFFASYNGLNVGMHSLGMRVKDEMGKWSLLNYSNFYILGLQAFLEGPFDTLSGEMNTDLNDNGLLPLQQPFNDDPLADWYYTGNETVPSIPNAEIVDWLLLQVRDTTNAANATTSSIKETHVAFLLKDGNIVDLDGITPLAFAQPVNNDIYVVIFHRNHLGILSSQAVSQSGGDAYTYNFSNSQSQVYGDSTAHKEIASGIWGLKGGDGTGDGQIDNKDKNDSWFDNLGATGYQPGDFDLSGVVDEPEKDRIWLENAAEGSKVPE